MDKRRVKGAERRYYRSEVVLVGAKRILIVTGRVGQNKAFSAGKSHNQRADRYRRARKGYCGEVVATEH